MSQDLTAPLPSEPDADGPTTASASSDPFPRDRAVELARRLPSYARLAWRLSREPDLPAVRRLALLGAVAYLVSPIDAIPGLIPVVGQVDDVLVVLLALRFALAGLSQEQRRRHLEASGLSEADSSADLDAIAAMGAWLLRTGGRAGARASAVALDVGGHWGGRAAGRAGRLAERIGSSSTRRVSRAVRTRRSGKTGDDAA
jgi:uncharacterized membrane protein YkvA (DUF1232 family)